jgi:glycosyl transferase family 87
MSRVRLTFDAPSTVARLNWLTRAEGQRWLRWGLVAYAVIGGLIWIQRPGDFSGYLMIGDLVLGGGDIYFHTPNTWPPFFSMLCVPLALLARPAPELARGIWIVLNYGAVLLALHVMVRLVYGRALAVRAAAEGVSLVAPEVLIPLLLSYRFVTGNFDHLQVNIVIFTLALTGLYWQVTGREIAGSITLGAAAALKAMPVVFIPYLLYRRRYRAAALTALSTLVLGLSPALVFGWRRLVEYYVAWHGAVAAGWGVGKMNQSVFAMWDRFIGHGMVPLVTSGVSGIPESGDPRALAATVVTLAVVTLVALWLFRGPAASTGWVTLSEWSVVFIVSAIFGPVCWKAYLVVLLLPNLLLFAAWRAPVLSDRDRRIIGGILLAAFVLGALPSPGFVGKSLAETLEMASLPTIAALMVIAGLFWFHRRCPAPTAS